MKKEITETIKIKKLLPYTWRVFFEGFGKLYEVERKVIPLILEKENLIINSPKATGKTEAVVAPVIERIIKEKKKRLSVLYISPTRALVNDLYRRLEVKFKKLNLKLNYKTGENTNLKSTQGGVMLITTPESLDSLVSRTPWMFKEVEIIILDEVHLYENSLRGEQLMILLRRLFSISGRLTNFYALSATIENIEEIAKKFFPMEKYKVIKIKQKLNIEYKLISGENLVENLIQEMKERNLKKLLLFTNSREEVEELGTCFSNHFNYGVWLHHGSLSRRLRREVEEEFNKATTGLCIATSTLEFGIDIIDIDAVVLIRPPKNRQTLLQRIGRGNRRKEEYFLCYGVYYSIFEWFLFQLLFEEEKLTWKPNTNTYPHFSVIVQQIFSYLYQKRKYGTTIESINKLFKEIIEENEVEKIIQHLIKKKFIEEDRFSLLRVGRNLKKLIFQGKIHSNLKEGERFSVIEGNTGKEIGKIEKIVPYFTLGKKKWKVVEIRNNKAIVQQTKSSPMLGKIFVGKIGRWIDWKKWQEMKIKAGIKEDELPYFNYKGEKIIFHFTGPIYGEIWGRALKSKGKKIEEIGGGVFWLKEDEEMERITTKELEEVVKKWFSQLKYYIEEGVFFPFLPKELQQKTVINQLNIEEFSQFINSLKLISIQKKMALSLLSLFS
jgi:ATP-dependent Lhr-like helicase